MSLRAPSPIFLSLIFAGVSFGLQAMWLFADPRIIIGPEAVHAGLVCLAAIAWLTFGLVAVSKSRAAILGLAFSAPFALYAVWAVFGGMAVSCTFYGNCV